MITQLVFFLEEESAQTMLEIILPKILPENVGYQCITFEGKQDLEKRLPKRLKGWIHTEKTQFIVLRDQDSGNCIEIKERLRQICIDAGKPDVLVRIACHELESFYLGDLQAVAQAFKKTNIIKLQNNQKFRNPDKLSNPVQELERLVPKYQKISGSRKIAEHMDINNNFSTSFNVLVDGIKKILNLS